MAIFKRIVFEFWMAFVLALGWAIFRAWPFQSELSWLGTFVANFGAAFFFVSYFTGQFVRIKRQATVEGTLQSVTTKLIDLTTSVGNLTTMITQALAREPALQPIARELSETNMKLVQANTAVATVLNSLPWQADTPLPLRVQHNPAALTPASDYVPAPPPSPTWPPPNPKATTTSN
jgi:hypothetical protein